MSAEVIVSFGADQDVRFVVEALMDSFEARAWLDGEFLALGCEPMEAPKQREGDPDRRGSFKDYAGNWWSVGAQL